MPDHERELAERANAELLRQIEESLTHSRHLIAQVNKVIAQVNEVRAQMRRANFQRVGARDWTQNGSINPLVCKDRTCIQKRLSSDPHRSRLRAAEMESDFTVRNLPPRSRI